MLKPLLKKANMKLAPQKLLYAPEWLVLGVNNVCNLHCKMCDVGTNTLDSNFAINLVGTHPINMPLDLFRTLADQAARDFPTAKLGYAFTEPLIYPYLVESLTYARDLGLYTSLTTNGLLLEKKAAALAEAGLDDLFLSLDGPEDVHNAIRGHKHSFQRALAGLDAFLALEEGPQISVFCVVTEWNIGHLPELADSLRRYPLAQLGFLHTNFTPHDLAQRHNRIYGDTYPATHSNVDEVRVEAMDLERLGRDIATLRDGTYPFPVTFSPALDDRAALERYYLQPGRLIGTLCHDIFSAMMIKSDGSVIPAHGRCYNLQVGNLYEDSLRTIWNGPTFGSFRRAVLEAGGLLPACSRCCSAFS